MKVTDNLFKGFQEHGHRTPNKGINQRNLKILADAADKICFEVRVNLPPCSEGDLLTGPL